MNQVPRTMLITSIFDPEIGTQIGRSTHSILQFFRKHERPSNINSVLTAEENWTWSAHFFEKTVKEYERLHAGSATVKPITLPRTHYTHVKTVNTLEARIARAAAESAVSSCLSEAATLIERLGGLTAEINYLSGNKLWPDITLTNKMQHPPDERGRRKWATLNLVSAYSGGADIKRLLAWRHKRIHECHFNVFIEELPRRVVFSEGIPYQNVKQVTFSYGDFHECSYELFLFTNWWQKHVNDEFPYLGL